MIKPDELTNRIVVPEALDNRSPTVPVCRRCGKPEAHQERRGAASNPDEKGWICATCLDENQ